jgi:uncharacterized protein (UPF0333 family)
MKGQGALEYLLLIGGAVLVAVIVIVIMTGLAGNEEYTGQINEGQNAIGNELTNAICQLTGDCPTEIPDSYSLMPSFHL